MPDNTVINNIRPDTITIAHGAFYNCTGLTDITIPASVTSIGDETFYGCSNLASITIPEGVTSIGSYAFSGCVSLSAITVDANNPNYASESGILYNKAKTEIVVVPQGISGNVTLPASLTSIGNEAFADCTSLTSITIPTSVRSIGDKAFNRWTGSQTIYVRGKANQAAADKAWGYTGGWRASGHYAKIVYGQ